MHATYCVIIAGASPGETKMWAAVRENLRFFALVVRIAEKVLKIDWYILRRVWQALNCLFIHATFCVIATGQYACNRGVPRANKKWRRGYVKTTIFFNCGSINWETVVDRQLTHQMRRIFRTRRPTNFKLGRRTEPRFAKVTILILLLRAAFSD